MKRFLWNKHTKVVLKCTFGGFCILAGLVMLVTPGQGLLTILLGVYLLADHIPFFDRIKSKLQQKFPKTTQYLHQKIESIKHRFFKNPPDEKT